MKKTTRKLYGKISDKNVNRYIDTGGEKYGIIKSEFPVRKLLRVPHQKKGLIVSYPAFGWGYFSENLEEMQKTYLHPLTKKKISFREPTTAESISASTYRFKDLARLEIFQTGRLQIGQIVRTSEGVFANPPKDKQGNYIIDEKVLKRYLNKAKKINGIYIVPNEEFKELRDFGFAPYESFEEGKQFGENFAINPKTNGLARLLEHTENEIASNFGKMWSRDYVLKGGVWEFDPVSESIARMVVLTEDQGDSWNFGGIKVYGNGKSDDFGYAFGVYAPKKNE
jgi:hypothetical protein